MTLADSFNEAGADCPGMRAFCPAVDVACKRFNEAGADCPGMHLDAGRRGLNALGASMRPGQTAPECPDGQNNLDADSLLLQ